MPNPYQAAPTTEMEIAIATPRFAHMYGDDVLRNLASEPSQKQKTNLQCNVETVAPARQAHKQP